MKRSPPYGGIKPRSPGSGAGTARAALAWLGLVLLLWPRAAWPQTGGVQTGLHYYVLENLDTGEVLQRGKTGSAGVAFDRLFLAANTRYRIKVLQAATLLTGQIRFTSPENGVRFRIPDIRLGTDLSRDSDQDGLSDDAEFILGTDPRNPDSDGDNINDGTEVRQGSDPLNNLATRTGVIGSVSAPGNAIDICAVNDVAIVASSGQGVSMFNIFNAMAPVLIGQVPTAGNARAVACAGTRVAVADGPGGLAILDITDPAAATVQHQVALGGFAQAVAAAGGIGYVGTREGRLAAVDLMTGSILAQLNLGVTVHDLALERDWLFVLMEGELRSYGWDQGSLTQVGRLTTPGRGTDPVTQRRRLFVGGGFAQAASAIGYDSIDVRNPAAMVLLAPAQATGPASFKQIVANGSGLGLAAVGVQPRDDGTHDLYLYDLSDPTKNTRFLTLFETPGIAAALTVYNGIAYVADSTQGLEVINYLAYDNKKQPPRITLAASFPLDPAMAEEGKGAWVSAQVADDVQVRNVEFFIEGAKVGTDGNFPFEHHFVTPLRSGQGSDFRLRARVSDTGGNATWSEEFVVSLVPDATPPTLRNPQPAPGSLGGSIDTVVVYASEPLDAATVRGDTLQLRSAGPDAIPGTPDDVLIAGAVAYRPTLGALFLTFPTVLPPGAYEATVAADLADLAGNRLGRPYRWTFRVFDRADRDHDGVPDEIELLLGLDPLNPDSRGDGVLDGNRDFDNDHLSNAGEILLGTDPRNPHSVNPGVLDGDLDRDGDTLSDGREVALGTNPLLADSDGDGWNDEAELTAGSDPMNPASRPRLWVVNQPPLSVGLPHLGAPAGLAFGTVASRPAVSVGVGGFAGALPPNVSVARPPVSIGLGSLAAGPGGSIATTIARPPVSVGLPGLGGGGERATTIAQPPVRIGFSTP